MLSIIIPVYKNTELFISNLKHNLPFLEGNEIIIINDDPTTSLKSALNQFPQVKLIENSKNLGFGQTINTGVKNSKGEYLFLLNSDVLLNDNSYLNALKHFEDNNNLFGVSFAQIEKNNEVVGKNHLYWHKGFYQHEKVKDNKFGESGWAEGGSCIINKEKFNKLKGFDKIYSPYYWEDVDLSYRAKKMNWSVIFDPNIKVVHHHESTINKYADKDKIKMVAFRNQLLFTWKNISSLNQKIEHFYYLFLLIISNMFKGNLIYLRGFLSTVNSDK